MNEYFKIFNSFLFGNRSPEDIYKLSEGKIRSMTVEIEKSKSDNDFYFNLQIIPAPNYKLNFFTKLIKNTKINYLNYSIRTIQNSINENTKAYNFSTFLKNEVEYLIQECFAKLNKVEKIYDSPLMLQAARNLSTQYSTNDYPNIKDKHFIYEYLYYSLIHIHLELQANFYSLTEDEPKTIDYFKSAFQFEHTPLLNPTIAPNQIKAENPKIEEKTNNESIDLSTSFSSIKDDLKAPPKKIHTYREIIYKPDWFARFEKQLFDHGYINEEYRFTARHGDKQILAAIYHQLILKDYFNKRTFQPNKAISPRHICKFLDNRYSTDVDRQFRNLSNNQSDLFEFIDKHLWLSKLASC